MDEERKKEIIEEDALLAKLANDRSNQSLKGVFIVFTSVFLFVPVYIIASFKTHHRLELTVNGFLTAFFVVGVTLTIFAIINKFKGFWIAVAAVTVMLILFAYMAM